MKPKGARFWTVRDAARWLLSHQPDNKDAFEAMRWWLAVRFAESMADMTTREKAECLLDGSSKVTNRAVTLELQCCYEARDVDEVNDELEQDFVRFFGIKEAS